MALPSSQSGADGEGVPPTIRELVQSHRDATGDSYHALEARSIRSPGDVPVHFSYFRKIVKGDIRAFPTNPGTFSGIARALGTTELAVILGYARQLDIPVRMPSFATQVPDSVDAIPPAEQRLLLQYLRVRSTGETPLDRRPTDDEAPDLTPEEIKQSGMTPGRPATQPLDVQRGQG